MEEYHELRMQTLGSFSLRYGDISLTASGKKSESQFFSLLQILFLHTRCCSALTKALNCVSLYSNPGAKLWRCIGVSCYNRSIGGCCVILRG